MVKEHLVLPLVFTLILHFIQTVQAWSVLGFNVKLPKINRANYNPYCFINECCNEDWIKFKRWRLSHNLTEHVFGQPLLDTAVNALSAHFNPIYTGHSKALTMSFHGMTGTGKNYVSNFIADSIFVKGTKSKYVHHFIGRMHFSDERKINEYKQNLNHWLKGNMTDCPIRLFIFDEVDKMIPEILNSIKPMLDHRNDVDGVDYTKAVFIFLSNTGADVIREHYQDLYLQGKQREDMKMSDFESYIQKGAFNEKGGFHHGDVITNNLIDHYVPFLPLEEKHIRKCIRQEFELRKVFHPKEEHIQEVMQFVEWGPDDTKLFSKTGCKRLGAKVGLFVDKYYHIHFHDKEEL